MTIPLFSFLGLSRRASEVYTALLKRGQTKVNELVKETGFVRQLIYESLAELEGKGLVNRLSVGKNRFKYIPASPETLRELASQQMAILDSTLPHLMKLFQSQSPSTDFVFYRGSTAVRVYWRELVRLRMRKTVPQLTIESVGEWYSMARKTAEEFPLLKAKKDIKTLLLTPPDRFAAWLSRQKGYEVRLLPKHFFHGGVTIYGDAVHFVSYDKNHAHMGVIHSQKIAQTLAEIFFMLWENSTPLREK